MSARNERICQITVVVDLAIEHDDYGAVLIEYRLLSTTEIDDAEAAVAETDVVFDEIAVIIRAAMRLSRGHALDESTIDVFSRVEVDDPANPAHTLSLRLLRVR